MADDIFSGKSILLVEDEESLAVGLEYNLNEEGYQVFWANDGRKAIQIFEPNRIDLVILDIMLPYQDGFEVARHIRNKSPQMPILMLTARTAIEDKVHGLVIGADDYMTKPFHLQELLLRVKGMLKRKGWYRKIDENDQLVEFGENQIDFKTLSCRSRNRYFRLTPLEAMVIKYLIDHHGKIITRKELLENVWNINSEVETRTVDNFILHLRKYFESNPSKPKFIKSIRGAGYIFVKE